jgi:hypothetical protein
MLKRIIIAVSLLMIAGAANAADLSFISGLAQGQFKDLSKEAGAALSYKNLAPAAPLGLTGFDIGVEVTAVDINSGSVYWQAAFNNNPNDVPSLLYIPKIRARKGLPFGIDIGVMYSKVPDSNVQLYGGEISKAILDGTAATPALGVRATYTKLAGVNDIDLQTVGVDASISKGIFFLTPYAGVGGVWTDSKAKGNLQALSTSAGIPLAEEKIWQPRYFAGLEIKPFPFGRIVGEAEYMNRPIYSLKVAIGF